MSKMQRIKGKVFERKIARKLRETFPEFADEIRRSIQSRQAEESDVTGLPGFWIECQDAKQPTPTKKLEQAERDVRVARQVDTTIPIAVTHKIRAKDILVTLRLHHLHYIFGHNLNDYRFSAPFAKENDTPAVSILLEDFLTIAKEYVEHSAKCQSS
tara:strand:- start:5410 stop:5880 length:471 start_codon:yes stop_codon:yes gene_type:complete